MKGEHLQRQVYTDRSAWQLECQYMQVLSRLLFITQDRWENLWGPHSSQARFIYLFIYL